jgi:hypothetical protein
MSLILWLINVLKAEYWLEVLGYMGYIIFKP